MGATVTNVKRHRGIAGQFSITADAQYEGEEPRRIEFVGSTYGGPVVMILGDVQTFVTDPGRFGEFGPDWVRRFLEAAG